MESFDNLLFNSGNDLRPKPGFSKKVMGRLVWCQLRRNLLVIAGLGSLVTIPLMLRAHLGLMLGYATQRTSIVADHPVLFAQGIAESIPWPLVIAIAGVFLLMAVLRQAFGFLAIAKVSGAFSAAGFLLISSTAALASSTTNHSLGHAQQQLQLIVNGIGQPSVMINGVTYQFATNTELSEEQLQAFAEFKRTVDIAAAADHAQGISDSNVTGVSEIRVKSITEHVLTYVYADMDATSQKDQKVGITSNTSFLNRGLSSNRAAIKPGDLVLLNRFSDSDAIVIGKLNYPLRDYSINGYTTSPLAHRSDGRCYGNILEQCPNIPAAYTMLDLSDAYGVPDLFKTSPAVGKQLIEIYGTITQITPTQVLVTASDGTVWTMNISSIIRDANTLKLNLRTSDHLRVEVYTSPADRQMHTLHDLSLDPGRTMELNYDEASGSVFKMIQLPLKKVWHYGQAAEKL